MPQTKGAGRTGAAGKGFRCLILLGTTMLSVACSNAPTDRRSVAEKFMQTYFAQDNVAGAAELASGKTKVRLDEVWRQIEASGLKEPAKDKPSVDITLVEANPINADAVGYIYRVVSSVPGVQPITVKLHLTKEGESWKVSEFEQSP